MSEISAGNTFLTNKMVSPSGGVARIMLSVD